MHCICCDVLLSDTELKINYDLCYTCKDIVYETVESYSDSEEEVKNVDPDWDTEDLEWDEEEIDE